ncbi:MAG: hypothetical protein R3242_04965 [Akkermansiaceae bacterium]|nr:hypothetical protein [Akkermansiaceae bacterium]
MECVIADTCVNKLRSKKVGVSLTVIPCWGYGSETMDMDPHTPKASWSFNDTDEDLLPLGMELEST